ncbi:hypothetical protein K9M59_02140 [Candidatus Gracilibacteria bacterium]|nr:hypothetical protein [Candidatus Gracilibacteria bacterium]MCF7819642.1 hypothetical protein [Candidatus Gracilibacteria bacterium]
MKNFEQEQELEIHYFVKRAFYLNTTQKIKEKINNEDAIFAFLYFQGIELLFKAIVYWECSLLSQVERKCFIKKTENTHDLIDIFNLIQTLKNIPKINAVWKKKFNDEEVEDCFYVVLLKNCKFLEEDMFRNSNELGRYGFSKRGKKITFPKKMTEKQKIEYLEDMTGWDLIISFVLTFFVSLEDQILNS